MKQSLTKSAAIQHGLQRRLKSFFSDTKARSFGGNGKMAVGTAISAYRNENEDRAAIARIQYSNGDFAKIAVVCDGMGGLSGGAQAASEAISAFLSFVATSHHLSIPSALEQALLYANQTVFKMFHGRGGTTLTAIFIANDQAWAAHVGDSRLYSVDDDSELSLLSEDDTIQGAIYKHQGGGDEDNLDNRLLQFVGVGETIDPHIFRLEKNSNSIWLVTSDGAHGVGRKILSDIVRASKDTSEIARKVIYVAEALGTQDNATIACISDLYENIESYPYGGTNLSVWSPSQNLEIWLAPRDNSESHAIDEMKVGKLRNSATTLSTPSADNIEQIPPKKRTRRKSKSAATGQNEPEMEVLFQQLPKSDD